ncbi:hypothetical protein LINPERHAP2_LOCUS29679 [Linum perenne]
MGTNYTSTTFPTGLLVLVLVLITSTSTFPAAAVQYCGPDQATDPNFPGYVDRALKKVIHKLVEDKDYAVGLTVPNDLNAKVSAFALASCALALEKHMDECEGCLGELLPYVSQCSSYTYGEAEFKDQCSLGFRKSGFGL